jgi:hypothetical protein
MGMSGNSFLSPSNIGASIPGFAQYFFGNSGAPYEAANKAYQPFYQDAKRAQNPFFNAGTQAIPQFQDWLGKMKDPSQFINSLMGQYKESPYTTFLQNQATRGAVNSGSASGLTGSTPMMQQMQQNSSNIAAGGMNDWLQQVLGANSSYGAGLGTQMNIGQHSADMMSNLANSAGEYAGGSAYGQKYGENQDKNALWASISKLFGG